MAIVSCPECSKKSKVADEKLGKKVKGVCGHIYVATAPDAAPASPKADAPAAGDKVVVACTSCTTKLKVAATSLGKKLRCSKCQAVFVAAVGGAAAPPAKGAPKPAPPPPEPDDEEDVEGLPKKPANAVTDDDMDDFLSFAEKDKEKDSGGVDLFADDDEKSAAKGKGKKVGADEDRDDAPKGKKKPAKDEDDDEDLPKPKGKKPADDDDEEAPKGKSKLGGKGPKSPFLDEPAAPVYPSRMGVNLVVAVLLLGFLTFFGLIFSRVIVLPLPKYVEDKPFLGKSDPDAAEWLKLDGKWVVESAELDGKQLDSLKGKEVVFADRKVTIDFATPEIKAAPATVSFTTTPLGIDITVSEKLKVPGIYKFADNKLHLCINNVKKVAKDKDEYEPPKEFDSKQGFLLVLAKVEKKAIVDAAAVAAAEAQLKVLSDACDKYKLDSSEYPDSLEQLTKKNDEGKKYLEESAILDPWKKPYKYDKFGPKNNGARPDIWTTTPEGKTIGNWRDADDPKKVGKGDSAYSRTKSADNLKDIGLAIHSFQDSTKRLPAAGFGTPNSAKPLLSWRVAILPYIEQGELYKEFDLTKPWDDPHNMKLVVKMPKTYAVPGVDAKEGMTHYRTLVGPGTLLDPIKGGPLGFSPRYTLANIPDGLSIVMVVEAKEPTIWTKPDDLRYDPKGPLPKFGVAPSGFNVLLGDGNVQFVRPSIPESVLRPYLTCDNGMTREPLDGTKEKDKNGASNNKGKTDNPK